MSKRFAIVIGVAAAGVMALGAQTAASAPDVHKYDTKLTIDFITDRGGFYLGLVKSAVRKCMKGRRVVLYKQRPGADRWLGTDRSNGQGSWWLRPGQGPRVDQARVYAKVTRKVGDGFVCRADRSPTI